MLQPILTKRDKQLGRIFVACRHYAEGETGAKTAGGTIQDTR